MRFKKTVLIALLFVLALSIHTSAATKEEKAVKKVATSYFKAVKKYNATSIAKTMLPKSKRKPFKTYNADSMLGKIIKDMHKYTFKYKIKSIKVSGKTAKVKAEISYYDGYQNIVDGFTKSYADAVNKYLQNDFNQTQEEFNDEVAYNIDYEFAFSDWDDYTQIQNTTLKFKKYKGKWKISTVTNFMNKYINCNAFAAMDYVGKLYE